MIVGPIFSRELVVAPRRPRLYIARALYAAALLLVMCTAWMVVAGTQIITNVGDMARFGAILFQILAPLQMAVLMFMAAIGCASAVSIEKDRKTLILLLMTSLSNSELVLGKLCASLLHVATMLLAGLPVFMLAVLFGGTSFGQVGWTFLVTAVTVAAAGALGTTLALWREKTFQALAMVALSLVCWFGLGEIFAIAVNQLLSPQLHWLASSISPLRAIVEASSPGAETQWVVRSLPYLVFSTLLMIGICLVAILRVRSWNPTRDVLPGQAAVWEHTESLEEPGAADTVSSPVADASDKDPAQSVIAAQRRVEGERAGHIDDRTRIADSRSRRVWDNPVLWREMCTWAHGKKIIFIRVAYWMITAVAGYGLWQLITQGTALAATGDGAVAVAPAAQILAPLMLLSLVMINALAVTAITNERDFKALDLLLVSDLSPKEFLFGKLGGVLFITWDCIAGPLLLSLLLGWHGLISLENMVYLVLGWAVLVVFVAVLGLHSGMIYASSRQAIGVSLGTVFFLFLGTITSMMMMVSFTGNVEAQLTPFLASIVGGGVGLYVAWGYRNPSPAIALASAVLPLAMFFSITSLLLGRYLSVIIVVSMTYGFATTAMIIPALGEFNISMGRSKTTGDE